jgi:hypothetical protein
MDSVDVTVETRGETPLDGHLSDATADERDGTRREQAL